MIITKGLLYAARTVPHKTALIDGANRFSYKQLAKRTAQLKQSLVDIGVKKGDRVGLLMLNDFRFMELIYGITALGAIVVPLNIRFTPDENIYVLNDAGIKVLFIHKEFFPIIPLLRANVASLTTVILAEDKVITESHAKDGILSYEDKLEEYSIEHLTYEDVDEDDVAGLFYTGGTTGRAKGVMLTHKNLVVNAFHVLTNLDYKEQDVYLHAAPMFHLADQASTFAVTLTGGTHVIVRMFTPTKTLQAIQDEKVTISMLVPTMINMLLSDKDFDQFDLRSLQTILYGASPMPVELLKRAFTTLPAARFFQAYGMTEASPILTLLKAKDHVMDGTEKNERRLSSCGQAIQSVELKVVDSLGEEAVIGQVGEIIARGANIMKGYWNLPAETTQALRNGWYYTGDMGYKDEDEYFYVVDRAKDMIITGGENVYSVEVEQVLFSHPAVLECAVFGVPDERWGEAVKATIVLRQNHEATEEDILSFTRQRLANYKVPKSIDFLQELPKSGAGKILKRSLRDQYWKSQKRRVN